MVLRITVFGYKIIEWVTLIRWTRFLKLITEQTKQIASLKELGERNCTAIATLTKEVERISQSLEEHSSTKATTQSAAKVPRDLSVSA